jgi:catechol 2,3-dioxygenase-like lactoylglutathione lyase family enzyme
MSFHAGASQTRHQQLHCEVHTVIRQTATTVTGILNIGVPVSDHERALRFYVEVLGFEVRRDATFGPGLRWVEVAPPGSDTTIALAPRRDVTTDGVDTGIRLSTGDAESAHAALAASGVGIDDILRMPGVPPMFSFRDPDGNTLYIVEVLTV